MQLSRADLADFVYFLAIAKHRSFRRAAGEMGVTTSALSHAITALEARRGIRLLNRTTRSVTLTAAGEELRASIEAPLEAVGQAAENLNRFRDTPAGRVRINILEDAVPLLLDPVMPIFVERYPEVEVDISVSNRLVDVIAGGFDAGIRYGGTVPEDMIAQRLSPDIPWVAAASPAYLARFGTPLSPSDLRQHRCVGIRLGNDQLYRWELLNHSFAFILRVAPCRSCSATGRRWAVDFMFTTRAVVRSRPRCGCSSNSSEKCAQWRRASAGWPPVPPISASGQPSAGIVVTDMGAKPPSDEQPS
jgi:DNA-binding transcriptional LysR family regulator